MNVNPYLSADQQTILERAKVGVAGLGGLGSNVLSHLIRSGVTHFVAADFDVVSQSNLNRQFYFADQIGQKKPLLWQKICERSARTSNCGSMICG